MQAWLRDLGRALGFQVWDAANDRNRTDLLGSVDRSDGMKELTLGGWPLYRYMGDTKAGQMNGEGDEWFAVTPSGEKSARKGMEGVEGMAG